MGSGEGLGRGGGSLGGVSPVREPWVWLLCESCVRSHPSLQGAGRLSACLARASSEMLSGTRTGRCCRLCGHLHGGPHLNPTSRDCQVSEARSRAWTKSRPSITRGDPEAVSQGTVQGREGELHPLRSLTLVSLGHRPQDPGSHQPVSPTVDREAVTRPACALRRAGAVLPVSWA